MKRAVTSAGRSLAGTVPAADRGDARQAEMQPPHGAKRESDIDRPSPPSHPPLGYATAHGGLLFLLPVLSRLALPAWAADCGIEPGLLARAVLRAALARLGVPVADPAWQLAHDDTDDHAQADRLGIAAAPACWSSGALAPPRGRPAASLAECLAASSTPDAQARAWLDAARRWLRRGPGLGLHGLVCRPALLAATGPHVDLFFRLDAVDLRLRRAGLDLDPGWLPWFGRVVSFHYGSKPP